MNKVILIGNLTRDVEAATTKNGQAIAKMGLAINERYTNKAGNNVDKTTYLNLTAWGNLAQTCSRHLGKGSKVAVEGKILVNEWEKDGVKRKDFNINVERIEFLSPSRSDEEAAGQGEEEPSGEDPHMDTDNLPF